MKGGGYKKWTEAALTAKNAQSLGAKEAMTIGFSGYCHKFKMYVGYGLPRYHHSPVHSSGGGRNICKTRVVRQSRNTPCLAGGRRKSGGYNIIESRISTGYVNSGR